MSPVFFFLPSLPLSRDVLWVHLWGGQNILCLGILIQSHQLTGWNILAAISVSINLGWIYFEHIRVLMIDLLVFVVLGVLLTAVHTFLLLFSVYPPILYWFFIDPLWWHPMENCLVSARFIHIYPVVCSGKSFWYLAAWIFPHGLDYDVE